MTCNDCGDAPQSPESGKKSYLLYLFDSEQMRLGWCVVQSECEHGMQEFISDIAKTGLIVHDNHGQKFTMFHPEIIKIDDKAASHLPIVDPTHT